MGHDAVMPLIEVISSEEHVPTASSSSASKPASAAEVAAGISALGLDPTDAQGSEWSASEPAGLTNSERAQMDELREKYGKYQRERDGVGGGDAPHTDAALAQSQARMDADFRAREPAEITESSNTDDSAPGPGSRIKVCDVCRGMRVTHTEYNHRVMERMCERCEGEGVLQDGKPIVTPGSLAAEEAKEKQAKLTDAKVKEGMEKDHRLRRYAELFAVCELLEKKLDGYAQEIVDAQANIADGNAKVELEEATAELVQQVTLHRATLRTRLDGYRAELEPLEAQLEKDGVFASIVDLETDVDELP